MTSGYSNPVPAPTEAAYPQEPNRIANHITPSDNKIRRIQIQQLNHGYIVEVGCHSFAIEKPYDLVAKLSEYINNPLDTEKKWQDGKLF